MSDEEALYGDAVYADGVEDASDPDPAEQLIDGDREEPLDTGYSPPDREPSAARFGMTAAEQLAGEPLDRRLAHEVPDVDPEVPLTRDDDGSGRLVAPDEGVREAIEQQAYADDIGRAGSAASAEEAAMHTVDDSSLD